MSYDISLKDPVTGDTVHFDVPHQMAGGTYIVGGTIEAWLNITYNYAPWYYKDGVFPDRGEKGQEFHDGLTGIRSIYGLSSAESIPVLEHAIKTLENMAEDLTEEKSRITRSMVLLDIGYRLGQMQLSRFISFWQWQKCVRM